MRGASTSTRSHRDRHGLGRRSRCREAHRGPAPAGDRTTGCWARRGAQPTGGQGGAGSWTRSTGRPTSSTAPAVGGVDRGRGRRGGARGRGLRPAARRAFAAAAGRARNQRRADPGTPARSSWPSSPPGSATTPSAARSRPRFAACCRGCATSAGRARPRSTSAWPAAGRLDAYYERGLSPGTGPPGGSVVAKGRRARSPIWSTDPHGLAAGALRTYCPSLLTLLEEAGVFGATRPSASPHAAPAWPGTVQR